MQNDLLRVVDAAYAKTAAEEVWLQGIASAAQTSLDRGLGIVAISYYWVSSLSKPAFREVIEVGGVGLSKASFETKVGLLSGDTAWNAYAISRVSTMSQVFGFST